MHTLALSRGAQQLCDDACPAICYCRVQPCGGAEWGLLLFVSSAATFPALAALAAAATALPSSAAQVSSMARTGSLKPGQGAL